MKTILSEKIETVLRRGSYNSRMKDFYDIYLFTTKLRDEINIDNFLLAMKNTFEKRKSFEYLEDYENILKDIEENNRLELLWNKYSNKRKYAKDIKFSNIIIELKAFLDNNNILVH